MVRKCIQIAILLLVISQVDQWLFSKSELAQIVWKEKMRKEMRSSQDYPKSRDLAQFNEDESLSELDRQMTEEIKKVLQEKSR